MEDELEVYHRRLDPQRSIMNASATGPPLVQTSKKLGVSGYVYLCRPLSQANHFPRLATLTPTPASG